MPVTDQIADYLTRIRNAGNARHKTVSIPSSKLKIAITEILKEQDTLQILKKSKMECNHK